MGVFLSENNTEPYKIIDTLNYPKEDLIIYNESDLDIITKEGYFYVIFEQGEVHQNVEVEVTLDYSLGVSIEISKTDFSGNPIEWKTKISLGNVDASTDTQKYLIAYRWKVINNIYLLKPGEKVALITVTATT